MAGQGGERPLLLALSLLASLPLWMRRTFRIRVAADAAFGTAWFLFGVRRLGLETVVGMRRDRRLRGGGRLWTSGGRGAGSTCGGSWREAREGAARVLLPELVVQVILRELHALGLGPPGGGGEGLCGVCGRCKF